MKFVREKGIMTTRYEYHVEFFGREKLRAWISSKAILPWDKELSVQDQFTNATKKIRSTLGKTAKNRVKSKVKL